MYPLSSKCVQLLRLLPYPPQGLYTLRRVPFLRQNLIRILVWLSVLLNSSFTYTQSCVSAKTPQTCRDCQSYLAAAVLIGTHCTHTVIMLRVSVRRFSLPLTTTPGQSWEESCLRLSGWSRQAGRRRWMRSGRGRIDASWHCVFFLILPTPPAALPSAATLLGRSSWCLKRSRFQNVADVSTRER